MPFFLGFETPRFIQAENPKPRAFRKVPTGISKPGANIPIGTGNANIAVNNIPLNNIRISPPPGLDRFPIAPLRLRPKQVQPKTKVGQKIIRTDLTDLTSIASVKNVRRKINLPEGQVAEIESEDNIIYELTINFFVDVNSLAAYNNKRRPLELCNVALTTSKKGNLIVFQNKAFMLSKILKDTKTIDAIMKEVDQGRSKSVAYPVQIAFEISQDQLDKIDDFDLSLLFSFFTKSRAKNKSVVKDLEFAVPYRLKDDLKSFFVVNEPVKLSAATLSFTQTLLSVNKPASCNATGVSIFRRKLMGVTAPNSAQTSFEHVKTIDFENQTDTKTDEAYQTTLVDDGEDISPPDNSFGYLYRAVPIGKFGASPVVFDDDITSPITQANFETGADFKVFPIHKRGRMPRGSNIQGGFIGAPRRPMRYNPKDFGVPIKTSKVTGFAFKDTNFLGPNGPVPELENKISLVSYYTKEGITVIGSNLGNSESVSILRKNLTLSEKKYAYVETRIVENVKSITIVDEEVVDGHAYEYIAKTVSNGGLSIFSEDTTTCIFRDQNFLPDFGVSLEARESLIAEDTVKISIDVKLPQNILSLVSALLGGRGENDVFLQDIVRGRKDLTPLISLVVNRMNLETGEEVSFKMTSDPARFTARKRSQNAADEGDKLPNISSFDFTDNSLDEGSNYLFEVKVNLREPLSLTDETTSVIKAGQEPFILQACKSSNPLLLNRGVLPPTQQGEDFIQQKNIQVGRDRLLNMFTADNEFDLGITNARTLVPSTGFITTPKESVEGLKIITHRLARQGFSEIRWSFKDVQNLSHFELYSQDEYLRPGGQNLIKTSFVADIPAQSKEGKNVFSLEDELDILDEDDRNDFEDPSIVNIELLQQEAETFKVSVRRRYIINVIGLDETVIESTTSKPVIISSNAIAGARRGIKFAFSPKVVQKKLSYKKAHKKKNKQETKSRKLNYMNYLARKGNVIAKNNVRVLNLNMGFAANRGKSPNKVKQQENLRNLSKNLKMFQVSPPKSPKKSPGKGMTPKIKKFNLFKLSPFG
jgi:hypothetical protein